MKQCFQNSERKVFSPKNSILNHVINQVRGTIKDIFRHARIKNLLRFPHAQLGHYWRMCSSQTRETERKVLGNSINVGKR